MSDAPTMNPGQQLAHMRRRSTRPCMVCGQPMPDAYLKRRYCSEACHSRAARERRRGREASEGEADRQS
jgi:predicted nucleic acid-binding Zn ribbon protein